MKTPPTENLFRSLVDRERESKGLTMLDLCCLIRMQSGVSFSASKNAYDGYRVQPETAEQLVAWAMRTHGVQLDRAALMSAPPRTKKGAAREPVAE